MKRIYPVKPDGKLALEWLRNSSLRQEVKTDAGVWRSDGDRVCMKFKWFYRGGSELCMWLFRQGATLTAVDQRERSLPWVFRNPLASRAARLVPDPSDAGKQLDSKKLAKLLPGTQLNFGKRGVPVTMKLHAGGNLEIELIVPGPNGKEYDRDHGKWRIENDKVCLKPGWWNNGKESCFGVHAGSYAYAFLYEGRVTPILLRKEIS